MSKFCVVFDFDGVVHSYASGWHGATVISDPPVDGINEVIQEIRQHFGVVIVSVRCGYDGGVDSINAWLSKYGIVVDDVSVEKPPAIMYIDDRALTFDGRVHNKPGVLLNIIKAFKPWNRE